MTACDKETDQLHAELAALRSRVAELEATRHIPEPGGVVGHVTEDRRRIEKLEEAVRVRTEELHQSERKYRDLITHAGQGILVAQDGMIRFVNPACLEFTGYTQEQLLERSFSAFVHPDDQALVASKHGKRMQGDATPFRYAFRLIVSTGATKWMEAKTALVAWEERPASLCFLTDITERKLAEERRNTEKAKFQTLAAHAPLGLAMISEDGDFLYINPKFVDMFGYDLEDIPTGRAWFRRAYPDADYRDEVIGAWKRDLAELGPGEQRPRIFSVTCKDGAQKIIHFRPVQLDTGEHLMTCEDITDRKRAEEMLKHSEERFRALSEATFEAIFLSDKGICIGQNLSAEKLFGYTQEEALGRSGAEWIAPECRDTVLQNMLSGYEEPYEAVACRKDGSTFPCEIQGKMLRYQGRRIRVTALRDITERKAAQDELQRLFTAVEQAAETIVVTSASGRILYVNPAFETTTGYTKQEALGRNPRILQSGRHGPEFYTALWATLKAGKVWRGHFINRKKDGALYEEEATISPIKDESGSIINYVAVKRDVTTERALHKQLIEAQKMEAIGTLAGGIAHDFNNLLQVILGYSDILLMNKGPRDPDRNKLEIIEQTARDGADLVSRILTFSRKSESKKRPLDLNDEIRKAQKLLERTIPRMIDIRLVLAEHVTIINADPAQVEQMLLNLAVNASHAMPDGGQLVIETSNVSLSDEYLRTYPGASAGRHVRLTVSDTGAGMAPEVVDRIFEPFFTTKSQGQGTGLGLSMVHGIVSQHGGQIQCYSEPGRGTSFKIYFPAAPGQEPDDVAMTREMPAFGTETILLVDDDARIRDMGRQMLQLGGYTVLTAGSGEEALAAFTARGSEISLVILDIIMPGMGGQKCLEQLLTIDPNVRVIVASGYSLNGLGAAHTGTHARGYIGKPYDAKAILAAVRKVLDQGRL